MLDHMTDKEEVRKLLTGKHGEFSTLGIKGHRKISILDLAIDLDINAINIDFIPHRHCQNVIDEQWNGRDPKCGLVKFGKGSAWVELNDLHLSYVAHQNRATFNNKKHSVPHSLPKVRVGDLAHPTRQTLHTCRLALALCNPLLHCVAQAAVWANSTIDYLFFGYVVSLTVQEIHQMLVTFGYSADAFNFLDIAIIVVSFVGCGLRLLLIDDHEQYILANESFVGTDQNLVDLLNQDEYANSARFRANSDEPWPWPMADRCGQSMLLDMLRSVIGLASILIAGRLMDFFSFGRRTGVLLICTRRCFVEVFAGLQPMMIFNFGFAVAFNALAPNFHQGSSSSPEEARPVLSAHSLVLPLTYRRVVPS